MSKDKKSMDDVLASIRRIIKTDPSAIPPDAASLPPVVGNDETAEAVLSKLREAEDDEARKPLSTSDDPDETARAVLDELRKSARADARKAEQDSEKDGADPKQPDARSAGADESAAVPDAPPELDTPLGEPPEVDTDATDVPDLNDVATADSLILKDVPGTDADSEADTLEEDEPDEPAIASAPKAPKNLPDLPRSAAAAARGDAPVMVDEAALEAMIRRVVRDELMGEMGRRMTKNVQKLIQHEVGRSQLEKK